MKPCGLGDFFSGRFLTMDSVSLTDTKLLRIAFFFFLGGIFGSLWLSRNGLIVLSLFLLRQLFSNALEIIPHF